MTLIRTAVIGAAVVISAQLVGTAMLRSARALKLSNQVIVSGSATRRIRSDLAVWSGSAFLEGTSRTEVLKGIGAVRDKVAAFVKEKGIPDAEITYRPGNTTQKEGRRDPKTLLLIPGERDVWRATYDFEVRSTDIAKVEAIEKILESEFPDNAVSERVRYVYTKLAEIKVQMAAEAAKDARTRAEQVVHHSGNELGALMNARLGIMQINPAFSTEVSGEGNNDQSSLEKDVMSVVSSTFEVR